MQTGSDRRTTCFFLQILYLRGIILHSYSELFFLEGYPFLVGTTHLPACPLSHDLPYHLPAILGPWDRRSLYLCLGTYPSHPCLWRAMLPATGPHIRLLPACFLLPCLLPPPATTALPARTIHTLPLCLPAPSHTFLPALPQVLYPRHITCAYTL